MQGGVYGTMAASQPHSQTHHTLWPMSTTGKSLPASLMDAQMPTTTEWLVRAPHLEVMTEENMPKVG